MTEEEEGKVGSSGGVAFFASLFFLALIAAQNLRHLPLLLHASSMSRLIVFGSCTLAGAVFSHLFVSRKVYVFIHEFKHALLSGLAGNRPESLSVEDRSGHFEYSYTKRTAPYNAFIALAPYIVPLFTVSSAVAALLAGMVTDPFAFGLVALVGFGTGMDLVFNGRDISPHQSDIYLITGGYGIGLAYIAVFNVTVFTFVAAWIIAGPQGVMALLENLWRIVGSAVDLIRS